MAAFGAGFGADFYHVVGFGDDAEVVFDDDHGVAFVGQAVENADELFDVGHVEADGRLLEQVEIAALVLAQAASFGRAGAGEFGHKFDALGFAAGKRWAGLTEGEVAEAGFDEEAEGVADFRVRVEEVGGFSSGHLHHIGDGFAVVEDLEGLAVVAAAVAFAAGEPAGGQETHFEFDRALAEAGFAASAVRVEGKPAGRVAAHARGGESGEELADFVEDFDVSGGRRARGFADGGLVDHVDGPDVLGAGQFVIRRGSGFAGGFASAPGHRFFERGHEGAAQEGGFARAGDAAGHGEASEGNTDVDILQVVQFGALQFQPAEVFALKWAT